LEALAVVAYHQPILKSQIDKVRGVDCGGVLHTLLERNLIQTVGRESSWGRPILYGTTKEFLSYFGLNSLSELPKIEELETFLKEKESSKIRVEEKPKEKEESLQVNTEEEGVTMHERE
jgi:segregation and condensation protein B